MLALAAHAQMDACAHQHASLPFCRAWKHLELRRRSTSDCLLAHLTAGALAQSQLQQAQPTDLTTTM
jgi:hypothetical protein